MPHDSPTGATSKPLYHYCSTDAFFSIVHNRSIWLSSLNFSNDTMEGRLVNETIMRLAERDGLDASNREHLQKIVALLESTFDGLGFCLSEEGDLLSQWRGYADDARGVSIGFSHAYLEDLAIQSRKKDRINCKLQKVEYDWHGHESQVKPIYRELRKLIDKGAFKQLPQMRPLLESHLQTEAEIAAENQQIEKAQQAFFLTLFELIPQLFKLKTHAFHEEREWRLISILSRNRPNCLYRPAQDRIVPYREFKLADTDVPALAKVVLGPKHQTPEQVVKSMLKLKGFGDVDVRRSDATYR